MGTRTSLTVGYDRPAAHRPGAPRARDRAGGGAGGAGRGPNPLVGAVIVAGRQGRGGGLPRRAGAAPHAERAAIAACGGADLRGATLYVSLEPCCHAGRTPPCTDAILEAGFARVVIASDDPTEKAAGRGPGYPARRGRRGAWSPTARSVRRLRRLHGRRIVAGPRPGAGPAGAAGDRVRRRRLVLMQLGTLATIAGVAPRNLVHLSSRTASITPPALRDSGRAQVDFVTMAKGPATRRR